MTEMSRANYEASMHHDESGRAFERVELNGHWVEYRFQDENGGQTHVIAFPRTSIISDATVAELKRLDDAEAASAHVRPSASTQQ